MCDCLGLSVCTTLQCYKQTENEDCCLNFLKMFCVFTVKKCDDHDLTLYCTNMERYYNKPTTAAYSNDNHGQLSWWKRKFCTAAKSWSKWIVCTTLKMDVDKILFSGKRKNIVDCLTTIITWNISEVWY